MNAFQDLDSTAWLTGGVIFAVCTWLLSVDFYNLRQKLPVRSRAASILLGILALFGANKVNETLTDASDAQHVIANGPISPLREIYRRRSESLHLGYVLGSSGSPRLLDFSDGAGAVVEGQGDRSYRVGYLDEPQVFFGSGRPISYYKVVDVRDAETNDSYYHFDTRHHPVRAAIYAAGILVCLITGFAVWRMADACPDLEDDFENYHDSGSARNETSITSLDLESTEHRD